MILPKNCTGLKKLHIRPSLILFFLLTAIFAINLSLVSFARNMKQQQNHDIFTLTTLTEKLGISDLCLSTEARYTRHPAVSDSITPLMDHPGAIEHFPSGSFFKPTELLTTRVL
jgi:hypothetical protein